MFGLRSLAKQAKTLLSRLTQGEEQQVGSTQTAGLGIRTFNPSTHRIVPKNSSVYDPKVFDKYDFANQVVVPRAEAKVADYDLDTMLKFAQRHRATGHSNLNDDRVLLAIDCIPAGSGVLLDACSPYHNDVVAKAAEEAGYEYLPIDIAGDGEKVKKEDLCALTFDDNSIDVIFSVDTLEHIEDLKTAISNLYRVLKDDGLLIAHVPAYFFSRKDSPPIDVKNDPYGHVRYFSGPDLADSLYEEGFIPLRVHFNLDYGAAMICASKNPEIWNGTSF